MAFLTFNPSTGIKSLNSAIGYINDITVRASDLRPFLRGVQPDLIKEIKHEFDSSNPNKWQKISDAWREFKRSEGKPENIGIHRGDLMHAASDGAWKIFTPTGLVWRISPVDSIDFTRQRKIGITSGEWLRGLGRDIAKVIVGRAKNG